MSVVVSTMSLDSSGLGTKTPHSRGNSYEPSVDTLRTGESFLKPRVALRGKEKPSMQS